MAWRGVGVAKEDGAWIAGEGRVNTVAPEILFIQRAVEWLREGGRMGIVLPDGILGNPGDEPIRRWILDYCWVLASVDLPVETFIVEANVNILTSLLFLKEEDPGRTDRREPQRIGRLPSVHGGCRESGL